MICECCGSEIPSIAVFCPHCSAQVEGAVECEDYTYEAMVSYRHQDADRAVAKRLLRYLEGYRIPKHLESGRADKRMGKLFRDEDELSASISLPTKIEDALRRSRYLIVLCSPQSLGSPWVQREVETFASLHGRKRIILALVSGEPEDSFPKLLLQHVEVASDGTRTFVDEEPLAADFRRETGKKFASEADRIAATLIGCDYDDLRQRQRVRKMQAVAMVAGIVAAASLAFGAFSFYQQKQIEREHRAAQIHESELLAVEAEKLLEAGDCYQAINVALSALPESAESNDRPFVPAAQLVLDRAIGAYPSERTWIPDSSVPLTSDALFAASKYGLVATVIGDGDIELHYVRHGKQLLTIERDDLVDEQDSKSATCTYVDFSDGQHFVGLICAYGSDVLCIDPTTGEVHWRVRGDSTVMSVACGESVVSVLYGGQDTSGDGSQPMVVMYDALDGSIVQSFNVGDVNADTGFFFDANDAGYRVALSFQSSHEVMFFDAEGNVHRVPVEEEATESVHFADDAVYILSGVDYGTEIVEAYDASFKRKWVHEDSAAYSFDDLYGFAEAVNNEIYFDEHADSLLVTLSTAVVELDAETGEQINRAVFDKPILDLSVDQDQYSGILSDGQVFLSSSLFSSGGVFFEDVTTRDLTEARFVSCDGIGFFIFCRSIAPDKLIEFRLGDGITFERTREETTVIPTSSTVYWAYGRPCAVDENGLVFLDAQTFEPEASIGKGELPLIDWDNVNSVPVVVFGQSGDVYVWGRARSGASDIALYRVSHHRGTVLAEGVLVGAATAEDNAFGIAHSKDLLSFTGDGSLMWRADNRVILLDAETLAVTGEYPALDQASIDDACCGVDTVLVLEHGVAGGTRGSLRLVDRESGKSIPCDMDEYSFNASGGAFSNIREYIYSTYVSSGSATAVSPDADRVAIACSDGVTRVFSLEDGHLLWGSREIPAHPAYLAFVPDTDKMLVQDGQGLCSLVSAEDGSLLASTMMPLPTIQSCLWAQGEGMLVEYRRSGIVETQGMAVISVSEEGFGPYMDMPSGVALSKGFDKLLVKDGGSYYICPTWTLDESMTVARIIVEDHPLTEAETAYYQVD